MFLRFRKEEEGQIITDLQVLRKYCSQVDFDSLIKDIQKSKRKVNFYKFSKRNGQRSLSQNAYYWGAVIPFIYKLQAFPKISSYDYYETLMYNGIETTPSELIHNALASEFLSFPVTRSDGKIIRSTVSTAHLTSDTFVFYLAQIDEWVLENFGVRIPTPDEYEQWTFKSGFNETQEDFFIQYLANQ